MKILTCFTSAQLYPQSDENVPVLRNDSYGPCGDWWNQVIFDNTVFIVVGFKSLKKNNCFVKCRFFSLYHFKRPRLSSLFNEHLDQLFWTKLRMKWSIVARAISCKLKETHYLSFLYFEKSKFFNGFLPLLDQILIDCDYCILVKAVDSVHRNSSPPQLFFGDATIRFPKGCRRDYRKSWPIVFIRF